MVLNRRFFRGLLKPGLVLWYPALCVVVVATNQVLRDHAASRLLMLSPDTEGVLLTAYGFGLGVGVVRRLVSRAFLILALLAGSTGGSLLYIGFTSGWDTSLQQQTLKMLLRIRPQEIDKTVAYDGWGRKLALLVVDGESCLCSRGADGKPGGETFDADVCLCREAAVKSNSRFVLGCLESLDAAQRWGGVFSEAMPFTAKPEPGGGQREKADDRDLTAG